MGESVRPDSRAQPLPVVDPIEGAGRSMAPALPAAKPDAASWRGTSFRLVNLLSAQSHKKAQKKRKNRDNEKERALSQKICGHFTVTLSGLSNLFCVVFWLKAPATGKTPSKY
jgi:hypothetical protein